MFFHHDFISFYSIVNSIPFISHLILCDSGLRTGAEEAVPTVIESSRVAAVAESLLDSMDAREARRSMRCQASGCIVCCPVRPL